MGEGRDPEAIRSVMDRYFAAMREVIERHGGTVEKFVGDAVMVAFGIPTVHEDDALRALRAATEMRTRLAELNEDLEREWSIRIEIRTGVNTGEVIAGDSSTREAFATGDTVNTAARLEQSAGAGEILIGETTYRLVRHAAEVEPVDPLTLKGKAEPVPAFRLLGLSTEPATRPVHGQGSLVARERELGSIRASIQEAIASRRCLLVTVIGSPGVGKSRLVEESVRDPDLRVLRGGCLSYGDGITFWPIAQMIRQAVGISDEDAPDQVRSRIRSLGLGRAGGSDVDDRLLDLLGLGEGSGGVEETQLAVRTFVTRVADTSPLAIVIEDVHWAEPGLLQLFDYLVDRADGPIVVIVTETRADRSSSVVGGRRSEPDGHRPGTSGRGRLGGADPNSSRESPVSARHRARGGVGGEPAVRRRAPVDADRRGVARARPRWSVGAGRGCRRARGVGGSFDRAHERHLRSARLMEEAGIGR
jgi:class 3 adenylate cyclase